MEADPKTVSVEAENFICPNCGGTMRFDIKKQKFMCSSCATESDITTLANAVKEYDFSGYTAREKKSVPFKGMAVVSCQNCGFEISFDSHQIATTCPMCDSTQIATIKQRAGIAPDGVVPFKIDKKDAQEKFRQWVKKLWFAPNDFKKKYSEGALTGMYLPFWTYDSSVVSMYSGQGGKQRTVTDDEGKTQIKTDWYSVSGMVSSSFDDVQVCASDKETLISKILPYGTIRNTMPYSPEYLSGYYAEIYNLKADRCFETAKKIMDRHMISLAESDIRRTYDIAMGVSVSSKFTNVKYKHVMLPVWSAVFGYKGKAYKYLVNGETGKVSCERPYSVVKIMLAVLAAISAFLIYYYFAEIRYESRGYEDAVYQYVQYEDDESIYYYGGEVL